MFFLNREKEAEELDEKAEINKEEAEYWKERKETINLALDKLEGRDTQVHETLKIFNFSKANEKSEKVQAKQEELSNLAHSLQTSLSEMEEENTNSKQTLNDLIALGEDVSDGMSIVEERQAYIDRSKERLTSAMEKLGLSSQMFGSFETGLIDDRSDVFVKGDHFDQFVSDYNNYSAYSYKSYETPKEITISPSNIEGINITQRESIEPSLFWSQHESNGTIESFKEIASHIPEVNNAIASGETIDHLVEDPKLGVCTAIYYVNKPRVVEYDGYYEFDSNGRHRILAARELGYDIPVTVVGHMEKN